MPSMNTALQQPQSQMGSDCKSCRMLIASDGGQEDCLMEVIRSQWTSPFGNTSYCEHPSAKQFVDFVNSSTS